MELRYVTEYQSTHRDIIVHSAADIAPDNDNDNIDDYANDDDEYDDDDDDDDDDDHEGTVLVRGTKAPDDKIVTIDTDSGSDHGDRRTDSDDDDDDDDDDHNNDYKEDDGSDSSGNNQSDNAYLECLLSNFHFTFVRRTTF